MSDKHYSLYGISALFKPNNTAVIGFVLKSGLKSFKELNLEVRLLDTVGGYLLQVYKKDKMVWSTLI